MLKRIVATSIVLLAVVCVALAVVPSAPTLVCPVNLSENNVTNVVLGWNKIADADSYAIRIGRTGTMFTHYQQDAGTGGVDTTRTLLLRAGSAYYWAAAAKNVDGWGAYCTNGYFDTAPWPDPAARHRGRH